MRNHRIYHNEAPASALMSHAQAYRYMHQRVVSVPLGDTLTVRDRTGHIVAVAKGTGRYLKDDGACYCCPTVTPSR